MWQLPPLTLDEILLYSRKSRTDDPTLSIEEVLARHEKMLNDWVERNLPGRGQIPEANRFREVVSGETLDSRPRLMELLRRIESPRVKAILIVEPQRLSRGSLKDIGTLIELLRYSNTLVITLQYTYDLRDERDRDLFERELKRGNEFLEYTKKIMNNGKLLSVQAGNFIGQTPPYGFNKKEIKEGRRKCYILEPNPETAPVVKMIFEMYRDGMGANRIADKLNDMHIPSPDGGKWGPGTLPRFFRNEHYIGKVVWNKRPTTRTIQNGEVVISRPTAEEYLVYEGKHEAIIDMELWDAVQEKRGTIPPNPKAKNFVNPLAGLLFCKNCGRAMTRRAYKDAKTGLPRTEPRVACTDQKHCRTGSATLNEVLEEVVKVLRGAIADFEIRIDSGTDDSVEIHRQMVERMEKRLRELEELEISQWDEKIKGKIPPHVFERLNSETLQEIEEVRAALCTAKDAIPEPINLQEKLTSFQAALDALLDPEAPAREQNDLLKACIERIEYHREQVNNGHKRKGDQFAPIELDFKLKI